MYELVIIGGGPAGVSATVYAARKRMKTLLLTIDFGGQSNVSERIENWIGTVKISGLDLAQNFQKHIEAYKSDLIEIKQSEKVIDVIKNGKSFQVATDKNKYSTKTILIATGSHRRKLEIPGADKYEHKGLTYCASCDGPLFAGKDVVVVGGGNAGLETAAQLLAYCKSVTLLNRSEKLRGDEVTVNKLLQNPKMKIILNAIPQKIAGEILLSSIVYEDALSKQEITISVSGVFVEIGLIPTTDFVKNILELNSFGQIPIDPRTQKTKVLGIWAAGDCTDVLYHQNNIASGDAVRALEDIYKQLYA